MYERPGNDRRNPQRPRPLRIRWPAPHQGKHVFSFTFVFYHSFQADTYILKQDDAHIPELVKGEDANDALMIPSGAPDIALNTFISWC